MMKANRSPDPVSDLMCILLLIKLRGVKVEKWSGINILVEVLQNILCSAIYSFLLMCI